MTAGLEALLSQAMMASLACRSFLFHVLVLGQSRTQPKNSRTALERGLVIAFSWSWRAFVL